MAESQPAERQKIRHQAIVAVIFAIVVFFLGYYVMPVPIPNMPTKLDRIVYTLQWQTVSVLTLLAGIQVVAMTRLHTTAIDPINGRGEHHVIVDTRYVQNTLEQLLLSSVGQLILSTYLAETQMRIIPILVTYFVVGRICFWIGYRRSYLHRAFGFALTVVPNTILYIVLLYFLVKIGPVAAFAGN